MIPASPHLLTISPGEGFEAGRWRAVLRSGVDAFLIREAAMEAGALLRCARWCRDEAPDLELWVRGRLDVALAAGCGLHAPEGHPCPPPDLVPLSRPLHEGKQFPERSGAHQLLLAPILPVPGKGKPWGLPGLRAFLDEVPETGPRLLALGGMRPEHAAALRHPRLAGFALLRPLWEGGDPAATVAAFREAWAIA